jgi:putative component of membrane protein insertase Oxa1/YidC/SpoIIIJ protein YidD
MHTHHGPSRLTALLIHRIERYRSSSLAGRADCRFTPTCSRYAEEALRTRWLPVAVALIAWRLLRCNPLMHRRVADPVRRQRGWRLRPNTLPTMFSILALSGFVVVVTAGVAEAVGVNGGCTAKLNGVDPSSLDSDHALVVKKGGFVRFVGTVPPSVQNASKSELVSNTHIDVDIVTGLGGITSSDHPGHGPVWGGQESVDKYLKYGVGLYHVTGKATGGPGGWSCDGDAYVELKDGNPLGKPVGGGAAGVTLLGLLGAALASRAPEPDTADADYIGQTDAEKDVEDYATSEIQHSGDDFAASLGCLLLIIIATGAAFLGKDVGAAAVGATGLSRKPGRRIWSHGHPILGFISGLLLGIGITVLLQQFAVWPLTIVTAIVFPVVIAVICSLRAWLGKAYQLTPRM